MLSDPSAIQFQNLPRWAHSLGGLTPHRSPSLRFIRVYLRSSVGKNLSRELPGLCASSHGQSANKSPG